jgi:deoxycytidine triphosphate deaminase
LALSNHDIVLHRNRRVVIEPFDDSDGGSCTPAGYDLRVGFAIVTDPDEVLGTSYELDYQNYQTKKDSKTGNDDQNLPILNVPAGKSVAIITKERVYLTGRVLGTVFSKATITARGLGMNSFTVDPTFEGRLSFRMKNETLENIIITLDEKIATLVLETVDTETQALGQTPTGSQVAMKYDVVKNSLLAYEAYFEKVHTKGKVNFSKAVDEAKMFRRKWWLLRKVIQYIDLWKLRGRLKQTGLRFLELSTLLFAPIVDATYIVFAMNPTMLNSIGAGFLTPTPLLALAALNLAWLSAVKTIGK